MAKKQNQFNLDEIFRHLRTNIEFSQMDDDLRVINVVSISSMADGTLYVVSAKETDKRAAKAAIDDLERTGANVFGVVLTKVEEVKSRKYGYGYGYGYGEEA